MSMPSMPAIPSRRKEPLRIFIIEPENRHDDPQAFVEADDLWTEIALSSTEHPGLQPIGKSSGVPSPDELIAILQRAAFRKDSRRELPYYIDVVLLQPTEDTIDAILAACLLIRRPNGFPPNVPILVETNVWNRFSEREIFAPPGSNISGFAKRQYHKMLDALDALYRAKNT